MGRELQKKKNRSSKSKVKPRTIGRTKTGKKRVNFQGNEIIASNWDRSQTLEQNYKRLGLSTKLNSSVSLEKRIKGRNSQSIHLKNNSLAIAPTGSHQATKPKEVRVQRDPETGRILQIIRDGDEDERANPLDDPLNELSDAELDAGMAQQNDVVAQLEAQAEKEAEFETKRKRPRQQSAREEEWIAKLVQAHGSDITAMFRDKKLNPMQQSEGDIARRVKKWTQKAR